MSIRTMRKVSLTAMAGSVELVRLGDDASDDLGDLFTLNLADLNIN